MTSNRGRGRGLELGFSGPLGNTEGGVVISKAGDGWARPPSWALAEYAQCFLSKIGPLGVPVRLHPKSGSIGKRQNMKRHRVLKHKNGLRLRGGNGSQTLLDRDLKSSSLLKVTPAIYMETLKIRMRHVSRVFKSENGLGM